MAMEGIYAAMPERKEKYGDNYVKDPIYRLCYIFVAVVPLIWSIPGMPGFVFLPLS